MVALAAQGVSARRSPTALIRRHLESEGSATADVLGRVAGISSGLVSALLKQDLAAGRVDFIEGYDGKKRVYRHVVCPPPAPRLLRAIRELEGLGYTVAPPAHMAPR